MASAAAQIGWLAGMVEGEGCLYLGGRDNGRLGCPIICVSSTDLDVITRIAQMFKSPVRPQRIVNPLSRKPIYRVNAAGKKAASWLMTLYSFFGERRRAKARELLTEWRKAQPRPGRLLGVKHGKRSR